MRSTVAMMLGLALTGCQQDVTFTQDTKGLGNCSDIWYADTDGDGYGDAATSTLSCEAPSGHVADDTDCDDTDAGAHPDASEICDGIDNDCDNIIDDDADDMPTWYGDADGDGYGGTTFVEVACEPRSGYVANDGDCNDLEPTQNPGAEELCGDGLDNNCDGATEDSCTTLVETGNALYGEVEGEGAFNFAAGDINGDGVEDVVIGAPNTSNGNGASDGSIAIFLGPIDTDRPLSDADVLIIGEAGGKDVLGYTVDIPGDLDGDGLDDVVISGTQVNAPDGTSAGAIAAFSATTLLGAAEPLSVYDADISWYGEERQDYFGASLSAANIGGAVTLFGGASGVTDDQLGAVYLLSQDGSLVAEIQGENEDDRLGLGEVLAGGDFNADGIADAFIGSPFYSNDDGRGYFCAGPLSGDLSAADCDHIDPQQNGDQLGERAISAGDVDGDGIEDLWVSSPNRDGEFLGEGNAYLILGRTDMSALDTLTIDAIAAATVTGLDRSDNAGKDIARGADIDKDGFADVLMGASQLGLIEQGVAVLFYGPLEGQVSISNADIIYTGDRSTDLAGSEVAFMPESNSIIVDTPQDDLAGTNAGASWVISLK